MKDRVSTKILDNGATRYGVYDETGKLLRYEYIKLEDEPDEEGTILNKANLLTDEVVRQVGLRTADPTPNDMFNVLAHVGNMHVWERVQSGVTDYLTSTDRNAYPDQSAEGGEIPPNTTITYLGQLGNRARIEVGSYVGTGKYGSSNPNSLTFGFEPKIILFGNEKAWPFINPEQTSIYDPVGTTSSFVVNISWNGKSVSWYSDEYQSYQLNDLGKIYHYIAIG